MNDADKQTLSFFRKVTTALARVGGKRLDYWWQLDGCRDHGLMAELTVFNPLGDGNRTFYFGSANHLQDQEELKLKQAIKAIKNNDFNAIIRLSGHMVEEAEQAA